MTWSNLEKMIKNIFETFLDLFYSFLSKLERFISENNVSIAMKWSNLKNS
jgi:hypothetical protein